MQIDERNGVAGLDAFGGLGVAIRQFVANMGDGQDRTGFRHAVAGKHVHPAGQRGRGQALGEGGAADDHLAARQVDVLAGLVAQQHVQDGRDAMREGDAFLGYQLQQHVRHVAAGIDLLQAEHGGDVGHAPGVHVEHRRNRHIDVVAMQSPLPGCRAEGCSDAERVQHELPMAEIDALGQTGGAGGVEGRGAGIFVEIGEVVAARRRRQQGFVLAGVGYLEAAHRRAIVGDQDELLHRFELILDDRQNRDEFDVDRNNVSLGVIQRVQNLFRRQAHIHRLQHRAHHRHGKEGFQVAMTVPVHDRHRAARPDTKLS